MKDQMLKIEEIIRATQGKLLSGVPAARVRGFSTDSRTLKPGGMFIALKGKNFDGHDFIFKAAKKNASALLIENKFFKQNKDLIKHLPKSVICIGVDNSLHALGDLALAWRDKFSIPIIALTGSSGKTTCKEMIAQVLGGRYNILKTLGTENNFIGVPLNLLRLRACHEIACIEFGTNSFGEIERLTQITKPNVGIITNIGPAHLEKLKNRQGVFKEKRALFKGLKSPAIGLVNYDDDYLRGLNTRSKNIFGFSKETKSDFCIDKYYFRKDRLVFTLKGSREEYSLNTAGIHNIYNALAAIGVGIIFGLDQKLIARKLSEFKFPASRFNIVKTRHFTIIDDSYNANPLSLEFALESFKAIKKTGRKIVLIADMLELGKKSVELHRKIGFILAKLGFDYILSMGRLSENIIHAAVENGYESWRAISAKDHKQLEDKLCSLVRNDDIILIKGSHSMQMGKIVNYLKNFKKGAKA